MRRLIAGGLTLALMVGLQGCALIPERTKWVKVRPALPTAQATDPADVLYASAAQAIEARDYAVALDRLQTARARRPDDVRVLNAFGVVYDKLGRFDLSQRYYRQAEALGAGSEVVRRNMAYSTLLQNRIAAREAAEILAAGPLASEAPRVLAEAKSQPQAAPARPVPTVAITALIRPAAPATTMTAALTGRPLLVIDASGRAGAGEAVRTELARLGWSAPRSALSQGSVRPHTTIEYPPVHAAVAQALARSLPGQAKLAACANACEGLRLFVGQDAAGWTSRARPSAGA